MEVLKRFCEQTIDGNYLVKKFNPEDYRRDFAYKAGNCDTESLVTVSVLDVETTGVEDDDEITEIAIMKHLVDRENGIYWGFAEEYSSYNETEKQIPEKVQELTGITNEQIKGHKIDWDFVNKEFFEKSDYIIAHNAAFDRKFVVKYSKIAEEKIWACSMVQNDWEEQGFPSKGLEVLALCHGWHYESHRAMNDVEILSFLLAHVKKIGFKSSRFGDTLDYFKNAKYKFIAQGRGTFSNKDKIKEAGYKWEPTMKFWYKLGEESEKAEEEALIKSFSGCYLTAEEIKLEDLYK